MSAQTTAVSPKLYKQLLIKVRDLQQTAKANVYQRVKLLVQVFANEDFRLDHGADDFVLSGILDQYVSDIGWGFMELRSILEYYPNEADWKDNRLTKMHDEVVRDRKKRAAASKEQGQAVRRKPRRVTNADFEAVKNENRELRAKYNAACRRAVDRQLQAPSNSNGNATAEVVTLRQQLREAKERIAYLEAENARLKQHIADLQPAH
jgi:hypothetical protein